jgi:hypothetical protein
MDNLIKMTIYVVDIKNNTEVWRARREFFTGDFPASTLVEVRSLAKPEVLVEIEAVAYLARPIRERAVFWSDWCIRTPPLTRRTGLPSAFHRLTTGTLQRA